jgi:hypothetical protein
MEKCVSVNGEYLEMRQELGSSGVCSPLKKNPGQIALV